MIPGFDDGGDGGLFNGILAATARGHGIERPRCLVCQAAKALGYITRYEWAFGLDHALGALMLGPVLIGTVWYDLMFETTDNGELVISPAPALPADTSTRPSASTPSAGGCGATRAGARTGASAGPSG